MNIYPSKSLPFEPFVYLIGWSHLNKFYIGSSYGIKKNAHPFQLWTTYFTSSNHVKSFREINGEPDIIRIEKTFNDSKKCLAYEQKLLLRMKVLKDYRFINKAISGKYFNEGPTSPKTREKMSNSAKNKPPMSEETREKLRIATQNRPPISEEARQNLIIGCQKRPKHSDETRLKMSKSVKNRPPVTDETRLKMSKSVKNRPPMTEETHQKCRLAQQNREPITDETRLKMSQSQKNRPPQSKESLLKRSESMKKTLAAKKALKESSQINQSLTD